MVDPRIKWTKQACLESARQYKTRDAWGLGAPGAYTAAKNSGWREECCAHMVSPHKYATKQACLESARLYETRTKWKKGAPGAPKQAKENGWYAECCVHMGAKIDPATTRKNTVKWTKQACLESARLHETRGEWAAGAPGAYGVARQRPWFEACCAHMVSRYTKSDAAYIWRAVGKHYGGDKVYKIGITGLHRGDTRIVECAKNNGVVPDLVILAAVGEQAAVLEGLLLTLGRSPGYVGDGASEFRALSAADLKLALDLIADCAAT